MVSGRAISIAAGIVGTLFVGYCVYFDRQRRKDPNYKKKLRERRREQKLQQNQSQNANTFVFRDHEETQSFFLHEVQLGEQLLSQGDIERGVQHLANAVAVCGRPTQLLRVLQQTLPPNIFSVLCDKLSTISEKILEQPPVVGSSMVEEEVE